MLALSLRGIASRKLRTALTAFAVVLGISLVSGTYLLTDTIDSSFDEVFQTATKGVDVAVTPKQQISNNEPSPLPAAVLEQVRAVPGVAEAAGSVSLPGQIYDKDDDPLLSTGPPMLINGQSPGRFDPFVYVEGHRPSAPDEVALDRHSAERAGFALGDTVRLSGDGPQERFTLAGIAKFGDQDSLGGAAAAVVQTPVAQRLLGLEGEYTSIDVAAAPGVTPEELARRVRAELPARYTVRTGEQEARSSAQDIKDQLGFLRTFLFVFAGIALFVGAFLIVNTFSITVAQRVREFALLRMIGASRRQVLWAVVGEALVIGLAASVVGLLAGFAIAPGLRGLFKAFGADLPSTGIVVEPRTVIVSLLAGTVITLVAALVPAVRATRIPPVAALQEAASLPRGRAARWRTPLSGAVVAIGVVLLCVGLFGSASGGSAAGLVGAGAAVMFIGVGLLASHVVPPLAAAVGVPLEALRGVPGRLARENAVRNPRRTASTSAALMIGVALVAFVAIFASGLKASIDRAVDTGLTGDLIIQGKGFQPVPASATAAAGRVDGVGVVSPIRFSTGVVEGGAGKTDVSGVDPRTVNDVFDVKWSEGSPQTIERLGLGDATVAQDWADKHDVAVGDRIAMMTPTGARTELTVRGIYDDDAQLLASITVPNALLARDFNVERDAFILATTAPGASVETVKRAAEAAVTTRYPGVEILTKQEFKDQQAGQVNQLLALFYILLSLSVVVSLFGIVNTLALAIHERTRELGMLRAIGTSRRQVRQTVRYESVITALIGAVLGVALGAIFAVLVTIPLRSEGFTIAIPVGTLIVLLVLAAVAGVLAAIWPARRAAKLDVLRALAYE